MHLCDLKLQRIAKRLRRAATRLGCRTSATTDVQNLSHSALGVATSSVPSAASAGQSSSRGTRATFEDDPEEIGLSQMHDAPSTQPTQSRSCRERKPRDVYTPSTDALGKGKARSKKQ